MILNYQIPTQLEKIISLEESLSALSEETIDVAVEKIVTDGWLIKDYRKKELCIELIHFMSTRPFYIRLCDKLLDKLGDKYIFDFLKNEIKDKIFLNYYQKVKKSSYKVYQKGNYGQIIVDDDFDNLRELMASPSFDFNKSTIECFYVRDNPYRTNLMQASACYSAINCFKYLILNNVRIDFFTFVYAVIGGNLEIIHLIDQNTNVIDNNISKALYYAAIYNRNDIFEWLYQRSTIFDLDADYVKYCNVKIQCLTGKFIQKINEHFTFNMYAGEVNPKYAKPITFAIFVNDLEYFETIVKKHKCEDEKDKHGINPLFTICKNRAFDMLKLAVENGSNINVQTNDGTTPLMMAVRSGDPLIVQFLLDNGADLNVTDKNGWSALHYAFKSGNLDIVKLCVREGEMFDKVTDKKLTYMHCAAMSNNVNVVKYLLQRKVPYDIENSFGRKPCNCTLNPDIVKLLNPQFFKERKEAHKRDCRI